MNNQYLKEIIYELSLWRWEDDRSKMDTCRIIGIVISIILGEILGILTSWGDVLDILIGAIYVGYSVDGNYMNGAIHGVLVGVIAAVIVLLISLLGLGVSYAGDIVAAGFIA